MMMEKRAYLRLKSSLFPALYENRDSLFYYLHEKKLNQKDNQKKALLRILSDAGALLSFYDIVYHLIKNGDVDTLTELTLSEKVSSSKKAILCGYDSCLICTKDTSCNLTLRSLNDSDRINYLLFLRFVKARKALKMLKWGMTAESFKVLLRDPILMKFVANYALVVDIKNELKKEGLIKPHKTLYKGAGKYCPFDDLYMKT